MKAKTKNDAKPTKGIGRSAIRSGKVQGRTGSGQAAVATRRGAGAAAPGALPVVPNEASAEQTLGDIRSELASLRRTVETWLAPVASADAALDRGVDSMRRLLSELLEARLESVIGEMAAIRSLTASAANGAREAAIERLDQLLLQLGALRFKAERLDYFDPLIHQVVGEGHDASAPEGVILEAVSPGYRTARGGIVAKAGVAVNRRA